MDRDAAIYRCSVCGDARQFGHVLPDTSYEPLLHCGFCCRLTRHRFARVRERSAEEIGLRVLSASAGGDA